MADKTVGLVGCGSIGRELARRVRALGMNVLAYDPYLTQEDSGDLAHLTSLGEVLIQADCTAYGWRSRRG